MTTKREHMFTVSFTGDYFTLTTCVNAPNKRQAVKHANQLLKDHHGIDVETAGAWDTQVEKNGAY